MLMMMMMLVLAQPQVRQEVEENPVDVHVSLVLIRAGGRFCVLKEEEEGMSLGHRDHRPGRAVLPTTAVVVAVVTVSLVA